MKNKSNKKQKKGKSDLNIKAFDIVKEATGEKNGSEDRNMKKKKLPKKS